MPITIERIDNDYHFVARNDTGNEVAMDGSPNIGGHNLGARPMEMLLMALGGCSGIDVVSILRKGRQEVAEFSMEVHGQREPGAEPSLYQTIHIHYRLAGELDAERVRRAIQLSMEKYCSVAKTLEATATLTWSFELNGERYE
ncbi:MAG: OsmC family protein [Chlorobi bacterium]|nr:MAG: OsmC/Ohr family protein [Chlorobi bacterium OLB7]MBK8911978.1 OsmC family protein [Chlorobiota bacterium]MBX7215384.1 OsmC family protein [Candidatus Kapabacteria bacterium]